jgi:hypothetical protein
MSREAEVLAKLPASARAKFATLIQIRDERSADFLLAADAARGRLEDVRDASQALATTRGDREVTGEYTLETLSIRPPDPAAEQRQAARLARAQNELASRQRQAAEREAALAPIKELIDRIVVRLHPLPPQSIKPWSGPGPVLRRSEQPVDALNRLRARLEEINHEREAAIAAPVDLQTAKKRARAAVDALVARGRPNIEGLLQPRPSFEWPKSVLANQVVWISPWVVGIRGETPLVATAAPPDLVDALAVATWADNGKALLAKLCAEIDAAASPDGLSDEERCERLAVLKAKELSVERDEEALIEMAWRQGNVVERRRDADPRAVLGIEIIEPVESDVSEAA